MCEVKRESSPCDSSSSIASTSSAAAVPAGAIKKRPAGRTRFRETRHPVFRGVRSRSRAGGRCRWVCEVRVPGHRGRRLWLGTFESPEHAARAHDAAMLAVRGAAAAADGCLLNFPDSAWLLDVPPLGSEGGDVISGGVPDAPVVVVAARPEDAMSATSEVTTPATAHDDDDDDAAMEASSEAKGDERSPFEMDVMGDMGAGLYYASLAQGLLMDPPATSNASCCCEDSDGDVAVVPLWTY
nr:unnamed protein product [Digitaria exilis]